MINDYRTNTIEELKTLAVEKKSELYILNHKMLEGKEKNVRKIGLMRKDIARIMTVISEKRLNIEVKVKDIEVKKTKPKATKTVKKEVKKSVKEGK